MTINREPLLPMRMPMAGVNRPGSAMLRMIGLVFLACSVVLHAEDVRKNTLAAPLTEPVTIEIRMPQSEINVEALQTNAGAFGGGLIGAFVALGVDKSRAKKSEQYVNEIRNVLIGVDYQRDLVQRYEGGVNTTLMPVLGEVRYFSTDSEADLQAGKLNNEPDLLSIQYAYALIGDFKTLKVTMTATLWDRDIAAYQDKKSEKRIKDAARYFQNFTYQVTPQEIASLKQPNQRAAQWVELGKDKLSSMILSGMTALADALSYDLTAAGNDASNGKIEYTNANGQRLKAKMIKEAGSRVWGRINGGEMIVIEGI